MALQHAQLAARAQIPQPYRLVGARREQHGAVGRDGDAVDAVLMAFQRRDLRPAFDRPQLYRLVVSGRDEHLAVRQEGDGHHIRAVAVEHLQLGAVGEIPQPDAAVPAP